MELKQYWNIVKRRLLLIALMIIVVCTAVGIYSFLFIKPQFSASSTLIVNDFKDSAELLPSIDAGSIASTIGLIKTYKEIVKSPSMMKKVLGEYPDLANSYRELSGKVTVSSVSETQIMTITAREDSYEKAANTVNAVATVFQKSVPELMKIDNVSVLDQADPSEQRGPVAPNPIMNIAVAFILAAMAGIGLAFLLEHLDDTVKNEEDVEMLLGVPVLTSIPRFKERDADERGNGATMTRGAGRGSNVSLDT
ncbi:Wzz/FepE/Etk N-terminal domain-containing protein [Paenibacillus sp. LHD-117]|uniref:YveK family protein n=1 Tax=Paenibacillus sp. LHD-117 TaxID=3071412 RepID=UPI0027E05DBA|nr:Wzz/FepE/Etk N-terminal domain-containing protein [Paenibacillus sp. LHD-117]MDQ6421386.1 Wzz/FepE/Etk N-terminal domain-containing protein [Paenibacillus sp. LHD-117]